jgi:hypothetical protein
LFFSILVPLLITQAVVRYCNHFLVKEMPDKLADYLPLNLKFFKNQFQDGVGMFRGGR